MENGKTPLYVAFSTQKGGVGKTTFTVLAASYLHYLKGYDVAGGGGPGGGGVGGHMGGSPGGASSSIWAVSPR